MAGRWYRLLTAGVAACAVLSSTSPAGALEPDYSSKGKGTVGGALLGAELFVGAEALLGIESPWVYGAGTLAGGLAGGYGGFYLERGVTEKTTMLMLTAGMALLIPSVVVVMSATAYHSPRESTQDTGPLDEPPAETAPPDTMTRQVGSRPLMRAASPTGQPTRRPPSILSLSPIGLSLGVPAVAIRDVGNDEPAAVWGGESSFEYDVELFHWVF